VADFLLRHGVTDNQLDVPPYSGPRPPGGDAKRDTCKAYRYYSDGKLQTSFTVSCYTGGDNFRAVLVTVELPGSNQPVRFDRLDPLGKDDGFSPSLQPPFLEIAYEDDFRVLRLLNAAGLRLVSTDQAVVRATVVPLHPGNRSEVLARIAIAFIPHVPTEEVASNAEVILIENVRGGGQNAEIRVVDSSGITRARLSVYRAGRSTVKDVGHQRP
jgi:hypothetical protein